MELAIAATLYFTFGAWLVLPTLGAPPVFARMAIGLCGSEFLAALGWSFSGSKAFGAAAGVQIPVLSGAVFALAAAYAVFVVRNWVTSRDADPGHRRPRQGGRGDGP